MTSYVEKCHRFKDLHKDGCFVLPNAWDAGSARVLQGAGAVALGTTSAGYAWSAGQRDGAQTWDTVLANAAEIAAAVDLPVTADLLNGFGEAPEMVAETIRLAAEAGLCGASIEDTTGNPDAPLYDRGLAVERIAAALEVVHSLDAPFTLCARADALFAGVQDMPEVLVRLKAFDDAGAPLLYAPALMTAEEVTTVIDHVTAPINVLAGIGNPFSVADLAALGVRRISVGSGLANVAFGAAHKAVTELLTQGTFGWTEDTMTYPALQEMMDDA
ncbi:MAG: isocitrate lyase/phosphoenolpyruvate mutase family protein [Pseudomonadota bacterium]